jgi:hypothetical protein
MAFVNGDPMLIDTFGYPACLEDSVANPWTVDDCFRGRDFDFDRLFLPERIAGVRRIGALDPAEQRKLNQIRANSYCHLFALVEELVIPVVVGQVQRELHGDETRLRVLLRLAEEEVKHQTLMRRATEEFATGFATPCGLIDGRERAAVAIAGVAPLTGLLLTCLIEWLVHVHYDEYVRDADDLDPLMRDVLRYHWIDESRHARLDAMVIEEVGRTVGQADRDRAVDELLDLCDAVDEFLARQLELDVESFERTTPRAFTAHERDEIRRHQARAYRWTFLVSGLAHPRFLQTVRSLTPSGADKVEEAAYAFSG